MNLPDEELQKNIEKGQPAADTLDSRAYKTVFGALAKEPYRLPADFTDNVINRIESQGSLLKDYLWFGLGLLTFIAGAVLAVRKTSFKLDFGAFKFISGYTGLILFALSFIVLIHLVDKRFLRTLVRDR
jgi:hypothetical protein